MNLCVGACGSAGAAGCWLCWLYNLWLRNTQLQFLRREYPTPGFGLLLAIASLANGRVEEARRSLEEFGRIPIPPNKDYTYAKVLIALEERRWEDCKDLLALLPDSTVRNYTGGLFALGRDDPFTARGLFESCGDYGPAYWQLAILEVKRNRDRAMDYLEKADYIRHADWRAFVEAREDGTVPGRLVLLTTKGAEPYCDFEFRADDILMLGSESKGVPDQVHDYVDARVVIPMQPQMRSLNVAMATAMTLGEALRRTNSFPKRVE